MKTDTHKSAQHTLGPWRKAHSDSGIIYVVACDGSGDIAQVTSKLDGINNAERIKEQYANARLIAAAPDLLAALVRLVEWTDSGCDPSRKSLDDARAAIAKATGGAQ